MTSDKLTPIRAGFSMKDLVHQGPEQSKANYPSRGLRTPQKGSLRLHRPIQCDGTGHHLLEGSVPSLVSYSF
jgi:hypothetical protein